MLPLRGQSVNATNATNATDAHIADAGPRARKAGESETNGEISPKQPINPQSSRLPPPARR
jgi:hypothetical protein